ncbi:MAG: hypothetical protein L3K19_06365 [Thermoplasmata archaeon]|nr:hypothetical protein [Thermoplasmata archaeon]
MRRSGWAAQRRAEPRRGWGKLAPIPVVAVGLALLVLGPGLLPGGPVPRTALARAHAVAHPTFRPAPHPGLREASHPTASSVWYTQEGTTLAQWDSSYTRLVLPTIRLTVALAPSPVSIGYELNGLSDAGDWYQLVIADNWPGCASGYEEVTEIWTNSGSSGPITCDPTLSLKRGDLLELNLSFASSSSTCLTVVDRTSGLSHSVCVTPPDSGGTGFTVLSTTADSNGYFTGPMTEALNQTSSSCPDYSKLPTVAYSFLTPAWSTQYIPWADEFEYGGSGTYCFGGSPGIQGVSSYVPVTSYFDNSAGSGFNSRYAGAQNESVVVPGTTLRYETDPTLLSSVSASATSLLLAVGGTTTLTASVSGGVPPYGALWTENGTFVPNRNLSWDWNATSSGVTAFIAYGIDAQGDVIGPSNTVLVDIPGPLSVSRISASPSSGSLDVGQTTTLSVLASGGIAPYTFLWSGLPTGCSAANSSSLVCTPTAAGTFAVELELIDANGTTVGTPTMVYHVATDPVATLTVTPSVVEVGLPLLLSVAASGGAGTLQFAWSGLPPGCSGTTNRISCSPTGAGQFQVGLTVSDANGFALVLPTFALGVQPQLAVTLSVSHPLADVGQAIRLIASVTGGGGGFSYEWIGLPSGCLGLNASTLLCTSTSPGSTVLAVSVMDGLGGSSQSAPIALIVSAALVVTLVSSSTSIPAGTSLNLSAVATGGSGTLSYAWSGLPEGCVADNAASILCAPDSLGSTTVRVAVTDAAGETVVGNLTVTVTSGSGTTLSLDATAAIALGIAAAAILVVAVVVYRRRAQ